MEKVAKAMAIYGDYDGCFERLEEWAAATDEQRDLGEVEEPMDSDVEDAEWWRRRARAGLDALGLTATEEWGMQHPRAGYTYSGYVDEQHMRTDRARLSDSQEWPTVRRTVLRAETPWEVVNQ
ncbi:hypothetical protein [Agromyces sp. NBRC 114283]|uniref:hypothetical protein n=1 Tax=Agromyces sp. NBRC 114283 TaxID=2994521 RepID=UPI002554BD8D|nr:hypothetical protein [Agromyces sp. NBRC 114283]